MLIYLLLLLFAAVLFGYRIISAVPKLLHTPLMSGMNALSGITLLGALTVYAYAPATTAKILAAAAIALATINVVGGFLVTDRMLRMFKDKN